MIKNIIDFLLKVILFPLAIILIVYGGFVIMTAGGSPDRVAQGRKIITSAVVGIAIALLSWVMVDTVLKILTGGTGLLQPWNKIKC